MALNALKSNNLEQLALKGLKKMRISDQACSQPTMPGAAAFWGGTVPDPPFGANHPSPLPLP